MPVRNEPPLVLLDVDGVVNAVVDPVADAPAGYRRGVTQGLTITWRPSVVAQLTAWQETGLAELAWLTSWGGRADRDLAPLVGLPRGLQVLAVEPRPPGTYPLLSKLPAARRSLDPARWLAVAVEPSSGLTDADLDRVEVLLAGR